MRHLLKKLLPSVAVALTVTSSFAAGTRPRADIPDRLRDPLVSVWRLACIRPVRPSSRRIHPANYALAGGTAAANLALSHGRLL